MGETRNTKLNRGRQHSSVVQGRLSIQFPEDAEFTNPEVASRSGRVRGESENPRRSPNENRRKRSGREMPVTTVVHPPAYRRVIAGWNDQWRERWGRLANSFEETGMSWRDAETQAFVEVWNQIRQETPSGVELRTEPVPDDESYLLN